MFKSLSLIIGFAAVVSAGGKNKGANKAVTSVPPLAATTTAAPASSAAASAPAASDTFGACVYYTSDYTFPATEYPTIWQKPTTTSFNTAEFQQVYNTINWTAVPDIAPRTMDATGNFVIGNYNIQTDPDCWWSASVCVTPKHAGINPDVYICPEPETWGLTYDDGPNCTDTELYDFLKTNNQKATLFYIGSNVADWPKQAQRGFADGHQICIHTWSHPYMTTLTNQEIVGELYYTKKAIKYILGVTPLCWRPPFGDVDDRVRSIAQQMSLSTIIWDQDTDDWEMVPAGTEPQSYVDGNYQTFVTRGQNGTYATHGTIVLSHELNIGTMEESIKWYPQVKAAYKYVVPVATCMNVTQPYLETNVTYPDFATYVGVSLPASSNASSTGGSTAAGNGSSVASATAPGSAPKTSGASGNAIGSVFIGFLAMISVYALF